MALKTYQEFANELGFTKNQIYYQAKKIDQSLILQEKGTNYLTEEGQKLVAENLDYSTQQKKPVEEPKESETQEEVALTEEPEEVVEDKQEIEIAAENDHRVDLKNDAVIEMMAYRIRELKKEVNKKDKHIDSLTKLLDQSQQLQAHQQKQHEVIHNITKKGNWFTRFFNR